MWFWGQTRRRSNNAYTPAIANLHHLMQSFFVFPLPMSLWNTYVDKINKQWNLLHKGGYILLHYFCCSSWHQTLSHVPIFHIVWHPRAWTWRPCAFCFLQPSSHIVLGISFRRLLQALGISVIVHVLHLAPEAVFRYSRGISLPTGIAQKFWYLLLEAPWIFPKRNSEPSTNLSSSSEVSSFGYSDSTEEGSHATFSSYESISLYDSSTATDIWKGLETSGASLNARHVGLMVILLQ